MVLAVSGQGLIGILPLVQSTILNDAILHQRRSLGPLLALLVGLGVASWILQYVRRYLSARVSLDIQRDMAVALHNHVMGFDPARLEEVSTGDIMSRSTGDLTLIQMFFNQVPLLTAHFTLLVTAIVAMFVLSPLLALVVAVWIPVFLYLAAQYRARVFPASWENQREAGQVANVVEEAVNGVRVVKAFAQEDHLTAAVTRRATTLFGSRMRTARLTAAFSATLQAIPSGAQLCVLALGSWLALDDHVSLGVFLAFCTYLLQIVAPVRTLSGMMSTSQQARAGTQRVMEIFSLEPTLAQPPDAPDIEVTDGLVELDGVTFGYRPDTPVVQGLDLRLQPGERVAIVGGSGSGKSTVALLLTRFLDPTAGTIQIDGQDLRSVDLDSVHRRVGVVFEEAFLFASTIHENIAAGAPDASDAAVQQAARIAQAHQFITDLPNGYDTVVGERGYTLSGGQRQRIALARAILHDPTVLVLDDATSAVDARTERAIFEAFDEVAGKRTTLIIAHRASTLALASRIIVMDHGYIVAEGTHEDLLAASPRYRELLAGPEAAPVDDAGILGEVDPIAWPAVKDGPVLADNSSRIAASAVAGAAGGVGGGGPFGAAAAAFTVATPELLARVAALPPMRDEPEVDTSVLTGPVGPSSLREILSMFRKALVEGFCLLLVDAAISLSVPFLIRYALNSGVAKGRAHVVVIAVALFFALQVIGRINYRRMYREIARIAEKTLFCLRIATFAQLQRLSLSYYDGQMGGGIMTRMTSDMDSVAQLLQQGFITALSAILTSAGVLVLLLLLDPHLVLPAFTMVVPLLAGTWMYWHWSSPAYLRARDRAAVVNGKMGEMLHGIREIQALSLQQRRGAEFEVAYTQCRSSRLRAQHVLAIYFPLPPLLATGAKAITLYVGAHLFADGHLAAGTLIAVLLYFDMFFNPMQQLSNVFDQWLQASVATRRMEELMATPTATPTAELPVDPGRLRGEIQLHGVHFSYRDDHPEVLRGIDLVIEPGQTLALVGTTGAGKSTFVKLVARFYDVTAGQITIDGFPVRELDLRAFRRQLGYVPQESFLFTGDVRSNIAFGRPDATDVEVERAARAVGAHDAICEMPAGYRTALLKDGQGLSAGERQLICLARAQLTEPTILILDEATANLDLATEASVRAAMQALSRERTTLLIAHRLQTARTADRIAVVEEGLVVEYGSHDELVDSDGRYAELWHALTPAVAGGQVAKAQYSI